MHSHAFQVAWSSWCRTWRCRQRLRKTCLSNRSGVAHHGPLWQLNPAKVMAENYHENSLHENQAGDNQDLSVNAFCFQRQSLDLLVSYSSIGPCKTQSRAIREKSAAASFNPGREQNRIATGSRFKQRNIIIHDLVKQSALIWNAEDKQQKIDLRSKPRSTHLVRVLLLPWRKSARFIKIHSSSLVFAAQLEFGDWWWWWPWHHFWASSSKWSWWPQGRLEHLKGTNRTGFKETKP